MTDKLIIENQTVYKVPSLLGFDNEWWLWRMLTRQRQWHYDFNWHTL